MSTIGRVVVTGGAGFVGSRVVRTLIEQGIEVVVFDSLISGSRDQVPDGVELIIGDVRNPEALEKAFAGATHILHLAALISVPESVRDPLPTLDVNISGTRTVFEAARAAGVHRVVYASSAAVYGNDPELPKREDMTPRPESPYAQSKVQNEIDAALLTEESGIPTIGLRFFNIYGKGQPSNHAYASVIPRWVRALKQGDDIHVYGDGEQTRDFIDVRDIASAVCMALSSSVTGARIYNVASGTKISLRELKDILSKVSGKQIAWVQHPAREGDIQDSVADITAIQEGIGFSSKVSLEDGITDILT